MDKSTIQVYDQNAKAIADLHETLIPHALHELILQFFEPHAKTLDIGCGSGRDTAWLAHRGFDVIGMDASIGMLAEARKRHPNIMFLQEALPNLCGIENRSYTNILCSAVLMHLVRTSLPVAAFNLMRILKPEGHLLISFRNTRQADGREDGKWYESLTPEEVITAFEQEEGVLLLRESTLEKGRNLCWHTLIICQRECLTLLPSHSKNA